MSIRVMTIVWDRYPEGGSKLLTMLALADWGDDDGRRVYPSMGTLAAKIRMSKRQAVRVVHYLIETGYLELLNPENSGGRAKTNQYRIRLETLSNCHPLVSERVTDSTERVTSDTQKDDIAMSYEPLDPLKNQGDDNSNPEKPHQERWRLVASIINRKVELEIKNQHLLPLNLRIDEASSTVVDINSGALFMKTEEAVNV